MPLSRLTSAPLLQDQQAPAGYDNDIAARSATWKQPRDDGDAPIRAVPDAES